MAKTNLTKSWKNLSERRKRQILWDLMDNKEIGFKSNVSEEVVIEILKKTKDLDFAIKAESIRGEIYNLCLTFTNNIDKINLIKSILRIEE